MLAVIGIHLGVFAGGYIGVDVFFVLSGFLITALLYEEWERSGGISLRRFYLKRLRRLFPALLLVVGAFVVVVVVLRPFSGLWPLAALIAVTVLGINNWITAFVPRHGAVLGALVPTWTLAQEVQFYLLWPLVLCLLLRRRLRPRAVLTVVLAAIAVLLAAGVVVRHAYPGYNSYTSPFDRGAELLLGCAAALLWRERMIPRVLRRAAAGWMAAGALVFVLFDATSPDRGWYLSAALLAALLIVSLLSQAPAGGGRSTETPRRRSLLRAFGAAPLRYTGKISYGVYLYHLPIYYLLWTYVPGHSPYFYAPLVLTMSFAAAAASWKLIESRVLRRGRIAIASRARDPSAPQPAPVARCPALIVSRVWR